MLIFWDAGLVLLATPKTGTQALEAALAPAADMVFRHPPKIKHMTCTWARQVLPRLLTPEEFGRFEFVAVMREPVDWLGSWYRYRQRDDLIGKKNSTLGMDFSTFLSGYLTDPQPPWARIGQQWRLLRDGEDRVGVDHLFAYEDMAGLVGFLEARLERDITLDRVNVSPPGVLEIAEDLRAPLKDALARDLELYRRLVSGEDWRSL